MGKKRKQWQILFSWAPKSLWMVTASMKLRHLLLGRKALTDVDSILKNRHHFADKGLNSQSYGFPVVMYRCDMYSSHVCHKVDRVLKNWWFWISVLEKTLESPLDSRVIKPVNPKGYQPWLFIGRTDAKAEAPILWPSDMKSCLTGNDPDSGKDWG